MDLARLRTQLVQHEGLRLKPYKDTVGKLTIGIGHNLTDLGIPVAIAELLYQDDVQAAITLIDGHCPWWADLDDVRQRVFVDLTFNMGIDRLLGFHHVMSAMMRQDYHQAADALADSLWYRQVGNRGVHLVGMLRTGLDPAIFLKSPSGS